MPPYRGLALVDVSEQVVQEILDLAERSTSPLLFQGQITRSAQSVCANLSESFGRKSTADRNRALVIARGEAEETMSHLRANFRRQRIDSGSYWRLHNRLVTIVKMINALLH